MKLKKIASLMLAGVMAASMLAGCQNASNGGNNGNGEGDGENNGVVSGISSAISTAVKADVTGIDTNVKFSDDSALDENLKYAAGFAGVDDALRGFVTKNLREVRGGRVLDTLKDRAGVNDNYDPSVGIDDIGDDHVLATAEPTGTTMHDEVAVRLYAISSVIPQENINELVAEDIAEIIDKNNDGEYDDNVYLYSTSDSDQNSSKFNHTYTISVSSYTKSVGGASLGILDADLIAAGSIITGGVVAGNATGVQIGSENASVTFVAVQVVRTSAHQ